MPKEWDGAAVGGGAAGLSAALVLGRARRRTVVIDAEEQSNRASPVNGGLGNDQRPPAELYAAGRRELSSYPSVEYRRGQVRRGHRCDSGFDLDVDDGEPIRARRVLLATGMLYCPPEIPELPELWGTSMFRCPFRHGCNAFGLPLTLTVPDRRRPSAFETRIGYTGVVQGAGGLGQARQLATTR